MSVGVLLSAGVLAIAAPAPVAGCPADLDGDGVVDMVDLQLLLSEWNLTDSFADIDGNGKVGHGDLAIVLGLYGEACDGGDGTIEAQLAAIDNTAGNADASGFAGGVTDFTFDLKISLADGARGATDWTTSELISMITNAQVGEFYHHPLESSESKPPNEALIAANPALAFDSYFCAPTVIGAGEAGDVADVMGMLPPGITQTPQEVSTIWGDTWDTPAGTYTIARFTIRLNEPAAGRITIVEGTSAPGMVVATVWGSATHSATLDTLHTFVYKLVLLDPADLNGDGAVDAADLAVLLGAWGPTVDCPPHLPADFDEDCDVDAADLAVLLGAWG